MISLFTYPDGSAIPFEKIEYSHLNQLSDFEEGYMIEFKSIYDTAVKNKLSKSICSFANCSGGWLFIGVENKTKKLLDIQRPNGEIELNIINTIKNFVDVEIPNLLKAKFIENPQKPNYGIIAIRIEEGLRPPYISNGSIYVRNGAQSEPIPAERATIDYLYKKSDRTSVLTLKGLNDKEVVSKIVIKESKESLIFQKDANKLQNKITSLLTKNNKKLTYHKQLEPINIENQILLRNFADLAKLSLGKEQNIKEFLKKEIEVISQFIQAFSLKCDINKIVDCGNLKIYYNNIRNDTTVQGTDEEKTKYNNILKIYKLIEKFFALTILSKISTYIYRLDLLIANDGNYYDEDIIVNLYIPKNSSINFADLDLFSITNDYNKKIMSLTSNTPCPLVEDYDNYIYVHTTPAMQLKGMLCELVENKSETLKKECENRLKQLYEAFEIVEYNDEYDIVKIRFNKLNPNQIKHFPAPIFQNCLIDEIQYTIVSKYSVTKKPLIIKRCQ